MIAIIIPANNEEAYISACLEALAGQQTRFKMLVIVSANACNDNTVRVVNTFTDRYEKQGHILVCIDRQDPGKLGALNAAEDWLADNGHMDLTRIYLDADVICTPLLIDEIANVLTHAKPRYATGTLEIARGKSTITRLYGHFWSQLPFVKGGGVGAGFFAVNAAGRKRWGRFPDIISDDTFVRLNFKPDERIEVPSRYIWPMIEGFASLAKVRRRQDAGVEQLKTKYPEIIANEGKATLSKGDILRLALRNPASFTVYTAVHIATRLSKSDSGWSRGR